jgi:hypothetical protein
MLHKSNSGKLDVVCRQILAWVPTVSQNGKAVDKAQQRKRTKADIRGPDAYTR